MIITYKSYDNSMIIPIMIIPNPIEIIYILQ